MNDTRRTRAVLGVLLVVSLAMITLDYRGGSRSPLRGLRAVGEAVFGPLERGSAAAVRPIGNAFDTISGSASANRRIERLQRENQQLREQARAGQIDRGRVAELDRLLGTAGLGGYRVVSAEVISAGQGLENTISIDVGSGNGVRPDMTVMTGDGLVGRVTRVGRTTSTVLLATDASSSVGGRLEDSKEIGFVQGVGGRGQRGLRFQLLDSTAPLRPGQRVVSFGSQGDQPYVPGVPIGVVSRVEATPGSLTRTAILRPFVRFTSLDVVGVVVAPPKTDPHDAVLPPRPSPSPTASPSGKPGRTQGRTPTASPSPSPRG